MTMLHKLGVEIVGTSWDVAGKVPSKASNHDSSVFTQD